MPATRREFLQRSAALGLGALLPELPAAAPRHAGMPPVYLFSKHLQFLGYADMAAAARGMGFDGVDLTVRPGGHVLPERAEADLPRAAAALRQAGFEPRMMVTAITRADDPLTRPLLSAAKAAGFTCYRSGWLHYPDTGPIPGALERFRAQIQGLAALNAELGIQGAYQNHTGQSLGAAIWDLHQILAGLPPGQFGSQYDVRHATAEGGYAWFHNLRLIAPYINSLAVKDFVWQKTSRGWEAVSVPIGEGMVDFVRFFRFLRQMQIQAPMSLHVEYPLGGADQGHTALSIPAPEVFQAMRRDLARVRAYWDQAAE
jgi:sugar phosphate isomerase/epimerase